MRSLGSTAIALAGCESVPVAPIPAVANNNRRPRTSPEWQAAAQQYRVVNGVRVRYY
jgi:hypothetical protein